jgi:hypothetical protein
VKVLSEYIKHHVKEEEEEIFPSVSSEKEALDELGEEMAGAQGGAPGCRGLRIDAAHAAKETGWGRSQSSALVAAVLQEPLGGTHAAKAFGLGRFFCLARFDLAFRFRSRLGFRS